MVLPPIAGPFPIEENALQLDLMETFPQLRAPFSLITVVCVKLTQKHTV